MATSRPDGNLVLNAHFGEKARTGETHDCFDKLLGAMLEEPTSANGGRKGSIGMLTRRGQDAADAEDVHEVG
eukprot:6026748-Prorocentrum_lima.AAC.1